MGNRQAAAAVAEPLIEGSYPEIRLDHLETLTDTTGVIQHAIFSIPNRRTGYTTDDNSRALIAAVRHYHLSRSRRALRLVSNYLSFLHYAQLPNGKFHNFMSFDQTWLDGEGSEDCQGRVIWALAQCLDANIHDNVKEVARNLLHQALWIPETAMFPRGKAYSAVGLSLALRADGEDAYARALKKVADSLVRDYEQHASPGWEWFEPVLTYSNALLPRALFLAYEALGESRYLEVAAVAWGFLEKQCIIDGVLQIIGCNGWFWKGRERAWFDQQPVDAMMMVIAALDAYRVTGHERYLQAAKISFDWFFGRNALNVPLHDPVTGGCFDGLMPSGRNANQGSESTVSCLIAQIEMVPFLKDGMSLLEERP